MPRNQNGRSGVRFAAAIVAGGLLLIAVARLGIFGIGTNRPLTALGIVYVTTGVVLGVVATPRSPVAFSFDSVVAITGVSVAAILTFHLWSRYSLGRLDSPSSVSFWEQLVLAGSHVTVGVVTALFLPLGFARNRRQRTVVLALAAVPFVIGVAVDAAAPSRFGTSFVFVMLLLYYGMGAISGSLLYVLGASLRTADA